MKKWEYKILFGYELLNKYAPWHKDPTKNHNLYPEKNLYPSEETRHKKAFDKLGKQGWELVETNGLVNRYIFKRELKKK